MPKVFSHSKRTTAIVICALILTLTFLITINAAENDQRITAVKTAKAIPTTQNVMVNGAKVDFDAYNIGGSNYFKIRDVAYVLKDTGSKFEVSWDGAKNAINLKNDQPYTIAGGEMTKGTVGNKTATPTTSKIYLDGKEIKLSAYIINGSSYFRLVEVGQTLGFSVVWDEATKTVLISATTKAGAIYQPSDQEIQALFDKATEIYDWFDGTSGRVAIDYNVTKEYDGRSYQKVTSIKTMTDLKENLMEAFSEECVQEFMEYGFYREFDGILYCSFGDRGYMTLGDTEFTIIRESDKKIIYGAKTEVFDEDVLFDEDKEIVTEYQTIDFPLEYKNGKWVFTEYVPINAGSSSEMKKYSPAP